MISDVEYLALERAAPGGPPDLHARMRGTVLWAVTSERMAARDGLWKNATFNAGGWNEDLGFMRQHRAILGATRSVRKASNERPGFDFTPGAEPRTFVGRSSMRASIGSSRWSLRFLGAVALTTTATVSGCKKPEAADAQASAAKAEAPIKVQTTAVVERPMPEYLVLTGTLRASQESEVAADAAGKVTSTFVERGQIVKQGETLAVLDARGANLSATAANAQSQLQRSQLEQAQRECERVKALKDTGAISQAEYDRVTSQCTTSQWSAAVAQAQQQNAQKIVGDAVIRAPFTGIVGERYVNVGQYVQPSTRVVSLYAPDPLRLELTVPEANVGGLKQGQNVRFTVSAHGDKTFTGSVKFVSPNVRPTTRDLVIEAFCPNPNLELKPGMFAVARLEAAEKPLAVVPSTAIVTKDAVSRVYAVVDQRVQERIVQTGGERDGHTSVIVGLKVGENVIVAVGPDVHDGAVVQ